MATMIISTLCMYTLNGETLLIMTFLSDGWGASAVDAISTAAIMGNQKVVDQILNYIPTIDFKYSNETTISLFETTIRYLGGLLAGYDLLSGPALTRARFMRYCRRLRFLLIP